MKTSKRNKARKRRGRLTALKGEHAERTNENVLERPMPKRVLANSSRASSTDWRPT